jgi:hypothetical protein
MAELKVSLLNRSVVDVTCSTLFVKHIEGSMSGPELALNVATDGRLQAEYEKHEKDNYIEVSSEGQLPFSAIYALNFHKQDLPFTYASVDTYARRILQVATRERSTARQNRSTVATAIHGPGAGLDTSEAMETLLTAFASELQSLRRLGDLREIILIERDENIFDRLHERLKHLENKGVITYDGNAMLLRARSPQPDDTFEADTLRQRSLRHLFVAMPFAKEFDNLYYFGIKGPVEQRHRKCERVDHDKYVGDVVDRIKERIATAELVIADITGASANVFFEVGYADGMRKPIILLSQAQDVPFDLHTRSQIRYDPQDILSLSRALGETLDALLADSPSSEGLTRRSTRTRRKQHAG